MYKYKSVSQRRGSQFLLSAWVETRPSDSSFYRLKVQTALWDCKHKLCWPSEPGNLEFSPGQQLQVQISRWVYNYLYGRYQWLVMRQREKIKMGTSGLCFFRAPPYPLDVCQTWILCLDQSTRTKKIGFFHKKAGDIFQSISICEVPLGW